MNKTILATAIVTTIFAASAAAQTSTPSTARAATPIVVKFGGKITDNSSLWKFEIPAAARAMVSGMALHKKDFIIDSKTNNAVYTFNKSSPISILTGIETSTHTASALEKKFYHPSFEFTDMNSKPIKFDHNKHQGALAIKLALKDDKGALIPDAFLQLKAADIYALSVSKTTNFIRRGADSETYMDVNVAKSELNNWLPSDHESIRSKLDQLMKSKNPHKNSVENNMDRYKYSYNNNRSIAEGRIIAAKLDIISTNASNIPEKWKANLPVTVTMI